KTNCFSRLEDRNGNVLFRFWILISILCFFDQDLKILVLKPNRVNRLCEFGVMNAKAIIVLRSLDSYDS
ncbi:hypothetical protein, partial [Leptospira borgpetersenii]|uniref:hypothetical protein n=1 Tax=Leptospira borgpetersenii TaxID=174 RepID=UPI0005B259FB